MNDATGYLIKHEDEKNKGIGHEFPSYMTSLFFCLPLSFDTWQYLACSRIIDYKLNVYIKYVICYLCLRNQNIHFI